MKYISSLCLVALFSIALVQAVPSAPLSAPLLELLSNIDPAVNPETISACFNDYLPLLNKIAANYSSQYEGCVTVANQQMTNLTASAANNRTLYINETNAICSSFQACSNETDTLTSFQCFANASSKDVNQMYELSSEASLSVLTLTQGIKSIQDTEQICTSTAEHTYVTDTANVYANLNQCLQYGPTTVAAGSSTPTTTASPAPTTT